MDSPQVQLLIDRNRDLERELAEKNRSLEIEAALEKIRARTMAMQKSPELREVVAEIHDQLRNLGYIYGGANIALMDAITGDIEWWMAGFGLDKYPDSYLVKYFDHPCVNEMLQKWKDGADFTILSITGASKKSYDQSFLYDSDFRRVPEEIKRQLSALETAVFSVAYMKFGALMWGPEEIGEEQSSILKRFAKVFEQTYTRFLDLKKAEAQTKEVQIEAALENVRASSLAMHSSTELKDLVAILFRKLHELDFGLDNGAVSIWTFVPNSNDYTQWIADENQIYPKPFFIKDSDHLLPNDVRDARDKCLEFCCLHYTQDQKNEYFEYLFEHTDYRQVPQEIREMILHSNDYTISIAFEKHSAIAIPSIVGKTLSGEQEIILKRFSKTFEQAFVRFLDLQKAEAQAREANIEAALERVRSRTMAMQRSEELANVATVLFQQVKSLGVSQWLCGFSIFEIDDKEFTWYPGSPEGDILPPSKIPLTEHPVFMAFNESRRRGDELFVYEKGGEFQADHYRYMMTIPVLQVFLQNILDAGLDLPSFQIDHLANFSHGNLVFITYEPCPEMHDIFKRFAKVFDQTYTRFLDLQKAEAQAKEAQIELGLERVRARAMAMQKSNELSELVDTVFKELTKLDFALSWCMINIIDEPSMSNTVWGANPEIGKAPESYHMLFEDYRFHHEMFSAWKEKQAKWVFVLKETEKEIYDEYLFNQTEFRKVPEEVQKVMRSTKQYVASFTFSNFGGLQTVGEVPLSEENLDILGRFGKVFDLTYTRFNDLQKAEAQAREATIETALERVRSRSMGMQKSDELKEVIQLVFEQFIHLNINIEHTGFVVDYTKGGDWHFWIADQHATPSQITVPYFDSDWGISFNEAKEKGFDFFTTHLDFEEKNRFYHDLLQHIPGLPDETKEFYFSCPGLGVSTVLFENVSLYIENFSGTLYSDEENKTLMRFGKVFQQTYTRFLDLQKAEAQGREAQIEAVLERIRSRTMAMQKSDELTNVAGLLFEQVVALGIKTWTAGFNVWSEDNNSYVDYITSPNGGFIEPYTVYTERAAALRDIRDARKRGVEFDVQYVEGEKIKELYLALTNFDEKQYEIMLQDGVRFPSHQYEHFVFGSKVSLMFITYEPVPEAHEIFKRLGKVFEQTYTRFLDLQKAEAQGREGQIQLAMERVRARTMAMQHSNELPEAANLLFQQVQTLGMPAWSAGYCIWDDDKQAITLWMSSEGVLQPPFRAPLTEDPSFIHQLEAHQRGEAFYTEEVGGSALVQHYQYMRTLPVVGEILDSIIVAGHPLPVFQIFHCVYFSKGYLLFITYESVPEAHDIFKRFGKVFDQTYTRFLDLKKAEAQTREAQIEASLERVRSRTMAMQHSDELREAANLLFHQVKGLDIPIWSCGYNIWEKNEQICTGWMSSQGLLQPSFKIPLTESATFVRFYESRQKGETFYSETVGGDNLKDHYRYMLSLPDFAKIFESHLNAGFTLPDSQVNNVVNFNHGNLIFISDKPVPDAWDIFKRFTAVFDQTYTRFLDLQKAEAQAIETVRTASLDRVRAEIASMRTTDDLQRITPLIWTELLIIGIPFFRCGVFIVSEQDQLIHAYLSTPEGKSLAVLHIPFGSSESIVKTLEHWRKQTVYTDHWNQEQFQEWVQTLVEQGQITGHREIQDSDAPVESLYLHFIPFKQGMLYVGSGNPLTVNQIDLVQSLADSFSVAYARYEDFKQLEDAKASIEVTLTKLKATQSQLIQSEKMASLGELTAGIAHEIQNPLNFVNNFSEVNTELLEELLEEAGKGNFQEVKDLVTDIRENEQKINHHGKRADAIVKGMLQHSRASNDQKELTDINALADEYLRLSYHGLRAKDKSFNATMNTSFDSSIGKVPVIPQDIGRVLLNLYNNAFYAVHERSKSGEANYNPTVEVITVLINDRIQISVKDNGAGISEKLKEKIFQPFFTTKPTGQGTGLGLSLSYDIITKGHEGELKLETKEEEGSTFTISLPASINK